MAKKFILPVIAIFLLGLLACKDESELIRDCPDEKIINKMPLIGPDTIPDEYYIYKGKRYEIDAFDREWVKKNCDVEEQVVY